MSKGAKWALIGCGGFLVLCCFALVGLVVVVGKMTQPEVSQTPAERKKIAESIVTFDLPPGYEVQRATEDKIFLLLTLKTVTIGAKDGSGDFQIELKASPVDDSANQKTAWALTAPLMSGVASCSIKRLPDDVVEIRSKYVPFQVYGCGNRAAPRMEMGTFDGKDLSVDLQAMGFEDFDLKSLHAFLRSIR